VVAYHSYLSFTQSFFTGSITAFFCTPDLMQQIAPESCTNYDSSVITSPVSCTTQILFLNIHHYFLSPHSYHVTSITDCCRYFLVLHTALFIDCGIFQIKNLLFVVPDALFASSGISRLPCLLALHMAVDWDYWPFGENNITCMDFEEALKLRTKLSWITFTSSLQLVVKF